jgi:hypothetical protein
MEDLNGEIVKKGMRTIWMIWASMFLSLWAYIVVCHELEKEIPHFKEDGFPLELLKYCFFALSVIVLYLSHRIRKIMIEQPYVKSDQIIIERANKLGKPAILVKYRTIVLVSLALSESIGLLGVVYFFLSRDYQALYILIGVSAIAMLYHRPNPA